MKQYLAQISRHPLLSSIETKTKMTLFIGISISAKHILKMYSSFVPYTCPPWHEYLAGLFDLGVITGV